MRYSIFVALAIAGGASAQNATAVVANPFIQMSTITKIAQDSTATTYTNVCSGDGRMSRSNSNLAPLITCAPFVLTQGPSTYEIHMTELGSDPNAYNAACKLPGGFDKSAECVMSFSGAGVAMLGFPTSSEKTTVEPSFWKSNILGDVMQTVSVLSGKNNASAPTATNGPTTAGAPGSPTPAASSSAPPRGNSGNAAVVSHTTLLTFVTGAASIFAACVLL